MCEELEASRIHVFQGQGSLLFVTYTIIQGIISSEMYNQGIISSEMFLKQTQHHRTSG